LVILIYFFSSVFIVLGFMMLFAYHRSKRKEFILLSFVYCASGVAAGNSLLWWPLIAGLAVAWLLKFAGYDADKPAPTAPSSSRSSDPPSEGGS
jgi:hypothetical protein